MRQNGKDGVFCVNERQWDERRVRKRDIWRDGKQCERGKKRGWWMQAHRQTYAYRAVFLHIVLLPKIPLK